MNLIKILDFEPIFAEFYFQIKTFWGVVGSICLRHLPLFNHLGNNSIAAVFVSHPSHISKCKQKAINRKSINLNHPDGLTFGGWLPADAVHIVLQKKANYENHKLISPSACHTECICIYMCCMFYVYVRFVAFLVNSIKYSLR